jgi:sigma54-dependent transcription regulator
MKLTKSQLKQIIKEELEKSLEEGDVVNFTPAIEPGSWGELFAKEYPDLAQGLSATKLKELSKEAFMALGKDRKARMDMHGNRVEGTKRYITKKMAELVKRER